MSVYAYVEWRKNGDMMHFGVFGNRGDTAPAKEESVRGAMRQRRMQCIEYRTNIRHYSSSTAITSSFLSLCLIYISVSCYHQHYILKSLCRTP